MKSFERSRRRGARKWAIAIPAAALLAALVTGAGLARTAAAPAQTSAPTVSGSAVEGHTLTASTGGWNNTPTSYAYQWQQCDASGSNCANISGATAKTYVLATADADHTVRVTVTAANVDGQASASSSTTAVVSSAKAPVNTSSPTISGTSQAGEQLSASPGTWTGGVTSYAYQWQHCDTGGANCTAVTDATARVYGVRTADVGGTLRVVVTATNASGTAPATSAPTGVVTTAGGGTTTVVTTVKSNHAPVLRLVSLRRFGMRIYLRFRVCDDGPGAVTVVVKGIEAHVGSMIRRFSVSSLPCGTHAKSWSLQGRFRAHRRYTVVLRAVDRSGASSPSIGRSLASR